MKLLIILIISQTINQGIEMNAISNKRYIDKLKIRLFEKKNKDLWKT